MKANLLPLHTAKMWLAWLFPLAGSGMLFLLLHFYPSLHRAAADSAELLLPLFCWAAVHNLAAARRFNSFVEYSADGFFMFDAKGRLLYINHMVEKALGVSRRQVAGLSLHAMLQSMGCLELEPAIQAAARAKNSTCLEIYYAAQQKWYSMHVYPTRCCTSFSLHDITNRREQERAMAQFQALVETCPLVVLITSPEGALNYVNNAARHILGDCQTDACKHFSLSDALAPSIYQKILGETLLHGKWQGEIPLSAADGKTIEMQTSMLQILAPNTREVLGIGLIMQDVTQQNWLALQLQQNITYMQDQNIELEMQREELEMSHRALANANAELEAKNSYLSTLATTDGLTGLYNHRAFQEMLLKEFQRAHRYHNALSLVLLDVDYFKQYNDSYGHPAGDRVLHTVAQIIAQNCRESDVVARYGGEEFALILPETGLQDAKTTAERIRAAIEQYDWELRPITVSQGVASLTPACASSASLVEEADAALYKSKAGGRNRVTAAAA